MYGHGGFFHRPEGPAGHFRTSVHASPLFARAVVTLLEAVDTALGHPDRLDLVDVGAGRGELLVQVAELIDAEVDGAGRSAGRALAPRLRMHAVELAARPVGIPADVTWGADLPEGVVGLVLANEWLDNIPVDVVEAAPDGLRQVLVVPATGEEAPGGPIGLRDASWLGQWWPMAGAEPGVRAEVGYRRDVAWAAAIGCIERGLAVAVDYGHLLSPRRPTLTGYRAGRQVPAMPDGSCDVTAHVALDSCAAATGARQLTQRGALRALGVSGAVPPKSAAYAQALQRASDEAELLDPAGLGGFGWLVQEVGLDRVL